MSSISSQISGAIEGLGREFDLITHNLANVSTVGYKRRINDFSQSLKALESVSEGEDPATTLNTVYDFTQGSFTQTERPLDMALCGKGFFMIETPEGPLYTRNGKFRLDEKNKIVDMAGRYVAGIRGPITVPPQFSPADINITNEGDITADGIPVGKLKLVDFKEDENKLVAVGMNCFQAPEGHKVKKAENLIVKQGFQEASNVKMVEELVDMITVSRLYEANMRFLASGKDVGSALLDVAMS
ncbi:MAG: flagellar hook-basal body protein [Planctomycetota bacterium]|jgi:flagellar basal body rod protein FlgG